MQLVAVEVALTTRCPYGIQSHTWEARETVGQRLQSPTKQRTNRPELKEAAFKSDHVRERGFDVKYEWLRFKSRD